MDSWHQASEIDLHAYREEGVKALPVFRSSSRFTLGLERILTKKLEPDEPD